jgi:hypothetical protein
MNSVDNPCKKSDQVLAQLMEEKESTMEKIKEFVAMTKNADTEEDTWESFLLTMDELTNDPYITKGCIGEGGCCYHCTACDKHLSGHQPLRDHQKSQNHRKRIVQKKSGETVNAQPLKNNGLGSYATNQNGRLGSCGAHACTYHCQICNKCMTGATPARQHLDSDKHKKKERDMPNCSTGSPPISPLVGDDIATAPDSSKAVSTMEAHNVCEDVSINSILSGCDNDRGMESLGLSTPGNSLAWDGYDPTIQTSYEPTIQTSFIQHNVCTSIGCTYHCTCCDTHLSGEEPMTQHLKSIKHQNMELVYTKEMAGQKSSPQPSRSPSDSDSVFSLSSMLDSLTTSSIVSVSEMEEITGPCGKIGCAYHCAICSTCLSGSVPKNQHLVSKNHSQVRDRLARAAQHSPKCESAAAELGMAPSLPDSGVEFSKCTQPGCAYHCHVCDMHLTGPEPMKQHMVSKNHEKRKKATVNLQMQSTRSVGDSIQGDGPEVSEAACSQPGCRFHCDICDLHLSGMDPMKQHMESSKHDKRKQAFLKLGGPRKSNMPTSDQFNPNNCSPSATSSETNQFASLHPHERQQPRPIGYERSVQGRSASMNTFSNDMSQPLMTPQHTPSNLSPIRIEPIEAGQKDDNRPVFGTCPENARTCKVHCFACEKHFNEKLPQEQHGASAKHKKLAQRYLAGLKTRDIQQEDSFISKSNGNTELQLKTQLKTSRSSSTLTGLPKWLGEDRQFPPIVKTPTLKYTPQTKTVARDYQMELYRKAMMDDTVCFLPTGEYKFLALYVLFGATVI